MNEVLGIKILFMVLGGFLKEEEMICIEVIKLHATSVGFVDV